MGFGGMIAIIGMLFAIGMQSSVAAKKFDTIQCSRLDIVVADGNVGMVLAINDHGGRVDIYGKDGVSYVPLNVEEAGGVVNTIDKFGNSKNR